MSNPQQVTPVYIGSSSTSDKPSNPFIAFWRSQVIAPEHRSDNFMYVQSPSLLPISTRYLPLAMTSTRLAEHLTFRSILRATALFVVGVAFVRSPWSNIMVPVF